MFTEDMNNIVQSWKDIESELDDLYQACQLFKWKYQNRKILVTGCNGFIGKWLINALQYMADVDDELIAIFAADVHNELSIDINPSSVLYNKVDVRDRDALFDLYELTRFDYVFHCAGTDTPASYMNFPMTTMSTSHNGTVNVMELCRKIPGLKSVIVFSTGEVYGLNPSVIPTPETYIGAIPTNTKRSHYVIGKLALESVAYHYHQKYAVPVMIARPFNLYGPLMDHDRVIPNFIKWIMANKPLNIYGDGTQTRTYCYITDAIEMILTLMVDGVPGQAYNIGSDKPELNVIGLVGAIGAALDQEMTYDIIPYPPKHPGHEPSRKCPDMSKTFGTCKFTPKVLMAQGIKRTYDYFDNLIY